MEGMAYWLPKGSILIDGTWEEEKDCTIKVGTLIEAETSSRWRLTRNINHLFEDNVVLEVDPATGLLKTVSGSSEDKTAEIVATALETAAKAMTFGAGAAPTGVRALGAEAECGCTPVNLRAPFHYKMKLPEWLGTRGYCRCLRITKAGDETPVVIEVQVRRMDEPGPPGPIQMGHIADGKVLVDGIVVRAPAPYKVTLAQPGSSNPPDDQMVFLPDPTRIYYLPLDRTPFVKNETKIALVNGVVQSVTTSRPSIILGIVGVPKTILTALVPLK
jgi:hypothetical protein